ncbi:MAG: class I SAM-dependent methyltransferase [Sporomusaceae bacterium]|nr:class I SAM-dependent methyltransferase [Sporomusaceae bacterium]
MKQEILDYIFTQMPTQQKKIEAAFTAEPAMEGELDRFLSKYSVFMARQGITPAALAQSYLDMLNQTMHARMEFLRTGRYPAQSQAEAVEKVYDNPKLMQQYMLGLALSQFLWPHHYQIFCHYRRILQELSPQQQVLEVGSGHGLYTLAMLTEGPGFAHMDIVDISKTSLAITTEIIAALQPEAKERLSLVLADVVAFQPGKQYDFITMGEVLEHVPDPTAILRGLARLMHEGSRLFVTTCANSPAIDHLYHFRTVEEIRQLLRDAGYRIVDELVAPSLAKDLAWMEKQKLDVSYSALLEVY